jgi:hypothetical protein
MPKHQTNTDATNANSALAYKFWLARNFRDGSPEEDLLRAVCVNSINSRSVKPKSRTRRRSMKVMTAAT